MKLQVTINVSANTKSQEFELVLKQHRNSILYKAVILTKLEILRLGTRY